MRGLFCWFVGIKGSYVISPFWSLEWGIAWEAQQGSTLSPTGASATCFLYGGADETDDSDLSWRKRGQRRDQPPCRGRAPWSRSSPPGSLSFRWLWPSSVWSVTSIARYPDAILRAKRKMIAARRETPRNLGRIFLLCSNLWWKKPSRNLCWKLDFNCESFLYPGSSEDQIWNLSNFVKI